MRSRNGPGGSTATLLLAMTLMQMSVWYTSAQKQCSNFNDIFVNPNKYDPEFNLLAYVTPPIRVDFTDVPNLFTFGIIDRDFFVDNINESPPSPFIFKSNDTNFYVRSFGDSTTLYTFNFKGKLSYNVNNAHRYVVELTVYDLGVPQRSSKALVYVPLVNYNCNPPFFTAPVIIAVAITFPSNNQIGILNAWDVDGDAVSFSLDPANSAFIMETLDVRQNGSVFLKSSFNNVNNLQNSINFVVQLNDDGRSCDNSNASRISLQSKMTVTLTILDVNMHSPQ